jgi:uncharacterized protein YcbK (DUF882 family)
VQLFGANVNEALSYRPRDEKGRARRDASRELQRLLRCRQTGQQHKIPAPLAEALYQIGRHYEGHRIEIYSGYRPRAYCTRQHSRHLTGSAIDFRVDGVNNEALIAYLRKTFHPAGVGYYPHGVHVHLDLDRTHDTYWIDPGDDPKPNAVADEARDLDASDTPGVELPPAPPPVVIPTPEAESDAPIGAAPDDGDEEPVGDDSILPSADAPPQRLPAPPPTE